MDADSFERQGTHYLRGLRRWQLDGRIGIGRQYYNIIDSGASWIYATDAFEIPH